MKSPFDTMLMVGWHENAGHKLVPRDVAEGLQARLADRVRSPDADLEHQPRLLEILLHTFQPSDEGTEPCLPGIMQPGIARALLRASVAVNRKTTLGSSRETKTYGLHWEALLRVYGGEENIRRATIELEADNEDEEAQALSLCRDYLVGWRPPDPFERSGSLFDDESDSSSR